MEVKISPLDLVFAKYMRLAASGICEYCGASNKSLQCSHFHGRRKLSTRYDPENCCAVCFTCHQYFHEHPNIHTEFFKKRLGSERFEQLNIRANMIKKMSKLDKENLKIYYIKKIKELE